MILNQEFW